MESSSRVTRMPARAECFEGLELKLLPDGGTLIAGPLRDQAELHAMLSRIWDMGITLVAVKLVRRDAHSSGN